MPDHQPRQKRHQCQQQPAFAIRKDCGTCGVMNPEENGYSEQEKERILRACRERGSLRGVERVFSAEGCPRDFECSL
jgi:hypothetical protein